MKPDQLNKNVWVWNVDIFYFLFFYSSSGDSNVQEWFIVNILHFAREIKENYK